MATINRPKRKKRQTYKNKERRKERMKVYNTARWRRLRNLKLADQPLCEVCLANGKVKVADEVHHIVSFMEFVDLGDRSRYAYDYDNLQSICKECHQKEHHGKKYDEH